MSKDLTEKWKNGKLKADWYYLKMENGEIDIQNNYIGGFLMSRNNMVVQVLTPVPSCEELQQLKEYERIVTSYSMKPVDYDIACETVNKLLDKNEKLKTENAELIETNDSLTRQVKHLLDLQANQDKEVESLRDLLKQCIPAANHARDFGLAAMIKTAIGESEER